MTEVIFELGKNFVVTKEEVHPDVLVERAFALIDSAKESGAKIVKFQVHTVEDEIHPDISITSPHFDQDRYTWVKRNSYSIEFWGKIRDYCTLVGLEFLATPMSRGAADLLNDIGVDRWKIGSGDILDFVMLDFIRDSNKPIILSSGMSSLEELKMSYQYLKEKAEDVSILHCVSQYPCPMDKLNLNTILTLKEEFPGVKIGFSDHSLSLEAPVMAVSLGAEIIEKHFTLSHDSWGPDHRTSVLPHEMKEIIKRIEKADSYVPSKSDVSMLGDGKKHINSVEATFRPSFRKGLYFAEDTKCNTMMEPSLIYAMRPKSLLPSSLPSEEYPSILGKILVKDVKKYELINFDCFN